MKTLENSQDKIQRICQQIKEESLAPAVKESQRLVQEAQQEADQILANAKSQAEQLHGEAKQAIEQERSVFESALKQAAKQTLEALRQSIEKSFFDRQLVEVLSKQTSDPKVIASFIEAIVKALSAQGLDADLNAVVPQAVDPRKVNELLLQETLKHLKEGSVIGGSFAGGAQVKLKDKNLTIDLSDEALKELLATYVVRKDFRKLIFSV